MGQVIQIGDYVRAFDFSKNQNCYAEGKVVGFLKFEGSKRYVIDVERDVFSGRELKCGKAGSRVCSKITPPVNGVQKVFGGECDSVVLLKEAA